MSISMNPLGDGGFLTRRARFSAGPLNLETHVSDHLPGILRALPRSGEVPVNEDGIGGVEGEGLEVTEAEVTFIPKSTVKLDSRQTVQVMRLIEQLEEFDDVQRVHTNLDISEAPVAKAA